MNPDEHSFVVVFSVLISILGIFVMNLSIDPIKSRVCLKALTLSFFNSGSVVPIMRCSIHVGES